MAARGGFPEDGQGVYPTLTGNYFVPQRTLMGYALPKSLEV